MRGMGHIYQRGEIYWIQFSVRGTRHFESSHSNKRADAVRLLKRRIGDVQAGKQVGNQIDKITLGELLDRVVDDYVVNERRSVDRVKVARANLVNYFGESRLAVTITEASIAAYTAQRKEAGRANANTNRELAVLNRAFRLSRKLLSAVPEVRMLTEAPARQGFLSPAEFARLHDALPTKLRDPISFLYFSCWRVGEMRTLQWRDVDMDAGVIRLRSENSKIRRTGRPASCRWLAKSARSSHAPPSGGCWKSRSFSTATDASSSG